MKNLLRFTIFMVIWVLFSFNPLFARDYQAMVLDNYDGDTLTVKINGKKEKVRLLGVDTAEMAQGFWGKEAKKFTENLTAGKQVRLETDVQERDRYGRLLAYVYVNKDFVNLELIKNGYAQLLTYPPNVRYVEVFQKAQKDAREAQRGIWGVNGLTESPYEFRHGGKKKSENPKKQEIGGTVQVNPKSGIYHKEGCKNYNCKACTLELSEEEAISKGYKKCRAEKY